MDGYIKQKRKEISSLRRTILCAYSVTIWILIFIPIWYFAIFTNQRPADWKSTEIVFSHMSEEFFGFRKTKEKVLNAQDGRQFIIKYLPVDTLEESMVPGQEYSLVYSDAVAGGNEMEALYDGERVLWELEDSVAIWNQQKRKYITAIVVTIGLEVLALFLIDLLWCKKMHQEIKKLREDISRREQRKSVH